MSKMNQEEIKAIIPHRDPFLLVDEIVEMTDDFVVGLKWVRPDEYYFKGHFPDEPVMPGVLIVESIAQTGAVCVLSRPEFRGRTAYFARINQVRFRKKVIPGDVLRLEMQFTGIRGTIGSGLGKAFLKNGDLACSAELTFAVGEPREPK